MKEGRALLLRNVLFKTLFPSNFTVIDVALIGYTRNSINSEIKKKTLISFCGRFFKESVFIICSHESIPLFYVSLIRCFLLQN